MSPEPLVLTLGNRRPQVSPAAWLAPGVAEIRLYRESAGLHDDG